MTDRDRLIELLDKGGVRNFPFVNALADHLMANGVTVTDNNVGGKWRPASEPPKNDYGKHWKDRQYYLVRLAPSGLMRVATFGYKEYDWWVDSHNSVLHNEHYTEVTRWMPLPTPPKEVDKCD